LYGERPSNKCFAARLCLPIRQDVYIFLQSFSTLGFPLLSYAVGRRFRGPATFCVPNLPQHLFGQQTGTDDRRLCVISTNLLSPLKRHLRVLLSFSVWLALLAIPCYDAITPNHLPPAGSKFYEPNQTAPTFFQGCRWFFRTEIIHLMSGRCVFRAQLPRMRVSSRRNDTMLSFPQGVGK